MSFDRYQYNNVINDDNGKRVIETVLFPIIPRNETDIYIYSVNGDRLDLLADEYYQDSTLWIVLASVNKLGHGSLAIPPGIQLRIPANPTEFLNALRSLQNR